MTEQTSTSTSSPTPTASHPEGEYPVNAGVWPRIFAFVIDILILGVVGEGLAWLGSSFLFPLGPFGQPLGAVFILLYFGILGSKVGGGQTLGKRLMKIAVRGTDNQPISLGLSFARAALLLLPIHLLLCLTFWTHSQIAIIVINSLVYAWELTIIFLFILGKEARQGLHDVLVHTHVIDQKKSGFEAQADTHRTLVLFAVIFFALIAGGYGFVAALSYFQAEKSVPEALYPALIQDSRFYTVSVKSGDYVQTDGSGKKALTLDLWYKGTVNPFTLTSINQDVAKTIFSTVDDIDTYDTINVTVSSRCYFGLYSYNRSYGNSGSPDDWRQFLEK